jgi:hypothetical protein
MLSKTQYILPNKNENKKIIHINLINILLDRIGLNKNANDELDNISKEAFLVFLFIVSSLIL